MQEILFYSSEFEFFQAEQKRNKGWNEYRLKVRRKLHLLGKEILVALQNKGLQVDLTSSLHHPYIHNRFAVEGIWAYFSPAPQEYGELEKILGQDVAQDLKVHYNHTLLLVGIEHQGLFVSMKIHPLAWWDGQNLKNKCQNREKCKEFLELLHKLSGFCLKLDDWPNLHKCENITLSSLDQYFRYYIPGKHWFHLDNRVSKENPLATSAEFSLFALNQILSLIDVYRFIRWQPSNNYVPQFIVP
ncbi:MAG: hypothetical protein HUU50_11575 [Candidatus Brocadiae bacterium]|nr:hypothetical protein [Candidatus Brocadiia bacterium]